VTEPCGCPDRTGHDEPDVAKLEDWGHAERGDIGETDERCTCGHPTLWTCHGYLFGGLHTLTIERAEP